MSSTKTDNNIPYTSSKADIWKAYKDALSQLEKPDVPAREQVSAVKQITTSNTKLKDQLIALKTNLFNHLDTEIGAILDQFTKASETLYTVYQTTEKIKLHQEEKKISLDTEHERQKEEYDYTFNKRKNRQEEELEETRRKVESELKEQKDELKQQQEELIDLRKQASEFDNRLETEINKASTSTEKRLKESYEHEKALARSENRNALALFEQKAASLIETVKNQQEEIKRLHISLDAANKQVTSIAEKAVSQAKSSFIAPVSGKQTDS